MKTVETVRGAVATDQLHSVLMHEHICTSSMGIATHYPQFYVSDYEERIIRDLNTMKENGRKLQYAVEEYPLEWK